MNKDSHLIWEAFNKGIDRNILTNYLKSLGMTSEVVEPEITTPSGRRLPGSTLWIHPSKPLRVVTGPNFVQVNYRGFGVPDADQMFTDEEHTFNDVFDFIQDAM